MMYINKSTIVENKFVMKEEFGTPINNSTLPLFFDCPSA
jgi:hypothetical protein